MVDSASDTQARYETHEAVSLAFITALQSLPPRQRVVLILRGVGGHGMLPVGGQKRARWRPGDVTWPPAGVLHDRHWAGPNDP